MAQNEDIIDVPQQAKAPSDVKRSLRTGMWVLGLGFGGEGMAQGFKPDWTDLDKLPSRVRIDVALANGVWPPLVLPVRSPPPASAFFTIGGGVR